MRPARAALLAIVTPLLLGGLLPVDEADLDRLPPAVEWRLPVGDPLRRPAPDAPRGSYRLLRNVRSGPGRHDGADLGNGAAGDSVAAAADGVVVHTGHDRGSGYGEVVVLAHRTPEALVYSVYAHLQPGSTRVRPGERVASGDLLGRVGSSGRTTTPHLHFEIRRPRDPAARWELAAVLDPLAWIEDRLPGHDPADTSWSAPYVRWAVARGIAPPGVDGGAVLTRADWWRMLAAAARTPGGPSPASTLDLRDSLVEWSLLPETCASEAPGAPAGWAELARDLRRLAHSPRRVPPRPLPAGVHREHCDRELGTKRPSHDPGALTTLGGHPTVGEACLIVADLGPEPRSDRARPRPRGRRR